MILLILCILLRSNINRRILIDAGDENVPNYVQNLKSVLHEENATISNIIITHWHHDHIGGVKDVLGLLPNTDGELISIYIESI